MFRKVIEFISKLRDEIEIVIDPTGLSIISSDITNICTFNFHIERKEFDEFLCTHPIKIGINVNDYKTILQRCQYNKNSRSYPALKVSYNEKECVLKTKIYKSSNNPLKLYLNEIEYEATDLVLQDYSNIEYTSFIALDSKLLGDSINDAIVYSNKTIFTLIEDIGFVLLSKGQIGELVDYIPLEDLLVLSVSNAEQETFDLNFLKNIHKTFRYVIEEFSLFLKSGNPLKVEINFKEYGSMIIYVKPLDEEDIFDREEEIEFTQFTEENILDVFKDKRSPEELVKKEKKEISKIKKPKKTFTSENFLSEFRDGRKKKVQVKQTNFTNSGNTIRSESLEQHIKNRKKNLKKRKKLNKLLKKKQKDNEKRGIKEII